MNVRAKFRGTAEAQHLRSAADPSRQRKYFIMACVAWCNQYTTYSPDCAGCSRFPQPQPAAQPPPVAALAGTNSRSIAMELNKRFARRRDLAGIATLADAGVLIHNFDAMESGGGHPDWLPCSIHEWCARFRDRVSVSVVNSELPYVFDSNAGGFVVSPTVAVVLCAFAGDGGTMQKNCEPVGQPLERCTPGCTSNGRGAPRWCKETAWT
jgi:hypothetical protein